MLCNTIEWSRQKEDNFAVWRTIDAQRVIEKRKEREKISLQKNNEWFYFLFEFSENEVATRNKDADASGQPQQQKTEKSENHKHANSLQSNDLCNLHDRYDTKECTRPQYSIYELLCRRSVHFIVKRFFKWTRNKIYLFIDSCLMCGRVDGIATASTKSCWSGLWLPNWKMKERERALVIAWKSIYFDHNFFVLSSQLHYVVVGRCHTHRLHLLCL